MAVSDGAGSAMRSDVGATVVARMFAEQTPPLPATGVHDWAVRVVERIAEGVRAVAEQEDRPVGDFAATLVGAVACPTRTIFVQVGDGIAVCRRGETFEIAIEPEASEFVNSTYFVTDAAVADHVRVREIEGAVDEIALLTDGLQPLVLHTADHQPHERFFETVFRNLRVEVGHDAAAAAWLADMLASDLVTSRTDDDTSIVVAKRGALPQVERTSAAASRGEQIDAYR